MTLRAFQSMMADVRRRSRATLRLVVLLLATSCWSAPAPSEGVSPAAAIEVRATSVSAGVGFSWGKGTLTYEGKAYPIEMDGLLVVAVGVSVVDASGSVYYLKALEDFDGNYTAKSGSGALGGGGAGVVMRNSKGVEVRMLAKNTGVTLSLGSTGVSLAVVR